MNYVAWLRNGLKKPGKEIPGLAKKLKLHPSAIYKMLDEPPKRKIYAEELQPIAQYLGEAIPGSTGANTAARDILMEWLGRGPIDIPPDGTVELGMLTCGANEVRIIAIAQPKK